MPDPIFQQLTEDARRLWAESALRADALQDIVDAAKHGTEEDVEAALERIDRAIAVALEALGYPRGNFRGVEIDRHGPRGMSTPSGRLRIGTTWLEQDLRVHRNPDTAFRTWVQESIHLRKPWAPEWRTEYRHFPGYEEGLAEGLALLVTREKAGMTPQPSRLYAPYVRAYDLLAGHLGAAPELLYRHLWEHPPGVVRERLGEVVGSFLTRTVRRELQARGREALVRAADSLFDDGVAGDSASDDAIMDVWLQALPLQKRRSSPG